MVKRKVLILIMLLDFCSCTTTRTFQNNAIEKVLTPLQEKCILLPTSIECPKDVLNQSLNLCVDIWGDVQTCRRHVTSLESEIVDLKIKPKRWYNSQSLWATVGFVIGTILGVSITK